MQDGDAHATRLESLLLLLHEGSSAQVRENAAERLGEAAAASPSSCRSVLQRLRPLVVDPEWDVRVAASKCLAVVARSVARSSPGAVSGTFAAVSFGDSNGADVALDLETVNVRRVVTQGAPLLRSGGEEYCYATNLTDEERRAHALKQRRLLLQRISGASEAMWKSQEGALAKRMLSRLNEDHTKDIVSDIERGEDELGAPSSSDAAEQESRSNARELLSITKRRRSRDAVAESPSAKRSRVDAPADERQSTPDAAISGEDDDSSVLLHLARLLADLLESMFDSKWETRHGSLLAVRQILIASELSASVESEGAKGKDNASSRSSDSAHDRDAVRKWLEEGLVRCVCVLALDQFVDYSADDSVAPVRELCAQVAGILLGCLHSYGQLVEILHVFRTLFDGLTWHAHHGGLLGLKYLVQAHTNHASDFVPVIFDDVVRALSTPKAEEDVLVLAAGMLEDFAPHVVNIHTDKIVGAGRLLWCCLGQESDRGFVRAGVVRALSAWYQSVATVSVLLRDEQISANAWPNLARAVEMLHHHSDAVRISTARCVAAVARARSTLDRPAFSSFCRCFLPHVLLQFVLETHEMVPHDLLSAWKSVVELAASSEILVGIASKWLVQWVRLLWTNESLQSLIVDIGASGASLSGVLASRQPSNNFDQAASVGWRVTLADALGFLASRLPIENSAPLSSTVELLGVIKEGLVSTCGEMQCGCLLLLSRWAQYERHASSAERVERLRSRLGETLNELARSKWRPAVPSGSHELIQGREVALYYEEQTRSVKRVVTMQARIKDIFARAGIAVNPGGDGRVSPALVSAANLSREIAEEVASLPFERLRAQPSEYETAHFKRQDLFIADELIQHTFARLHHRIQGLGSCAYCFLLPMPTKKSGFLVSALMESLKEEEDAVFRRLTAAALADFTLSQALVQKKCVAKVISNLCNSAVALPSSLAAAVPRCCSLHDQIESLPPDVAAKTRVRVAGAIAALTAICSQGGAALFTTCPAIEENVLSAWSRDDARAADEKAVQRSLRLMALLLPLLDERCAADKCVRWVELAATEITSPSSDSVAEPLPPSLEEEVFHTKHVAAVAIAVICKYARSCRHEAMLVVYTRVFAPSSWRSPGRRDLSAAVMVLDRLVRLLPPDGLIPYIPSLVHYAMMAMASQHSETRAAAARAFAELVPLIPLQMDLGATGEVDASLQAIVRENEVSRQFLESFARGSAIERADVQPWLARGVALREYQQLGVDWLAFMARHNLHGILADDMGLGKTLQALAAIAAWLSPRAEGGGDGAAGRRDAVCLVVCPPIVAHHWVSEARKCLPSVFTAVVDYSGAAPERRRLRTEVQRRREGCARRRELIVTTYAVVRSDEDGFLAAQEFAYVVLDEAHLVRNPGTALFRAVQRLKAARRLALSGTPLQNHVGDLWSLFEFLMPGYLGDFPSFRRAFALPIAKSRERNATAKQKEAAALALSQLHRKVLPFILRRTKDQVLRELPPKTVSTVLLPLSRVQRRLYALASSPGDHREPDEPGVAHVFADLQLLRRICVHPSLVRDERLISRLGPSEWAVAQHWEASGKLQGLRELLVDVCDADRGGEEDAALPTHRCLVFAHLRETLDVTERMLADALPRVSFRRVDGRTPPSRRAAIVRQFNEDPSIGVLLLTTAVGGLGLTLTGADTVVFLEHSWNPFVDLQAMDRAHRIGQTRAVRVFRLVMQGSLEEHVVNLQAFKRGVADSVVRQQRDARRGMRESTSGVLDLLQASSAAVTAKEVAAAASKGEGEDAASALPGAARELLEEIGELWDESQYESLALPPAASGGESIASERPSRPAMRR